VVSARVVASGLWLYDGITPIPVRVVELDYDFWYVVAEADGELEHGEHPLLNDNGRLYYVRYRPGWSEGQDFWPDSVGFQRLEDAVAAAEAGVPGVVTWDEHV
jgi:hypothetical protein